MSILPERTGHNMENNYPIPRNILEGFDIAGLMTRMASADWYYDYTEDSAVWRNGKKEIEDIKVDLSQLSKMENGLMVANYLWDAYVPMYSERRPDFLLKGATQNNLLTSKNTTMNQDNLEYLKKSLFYMGFENKLNDDLEKNITTGKPEFVLKFDKEFHNAKMEYELPVKLGNENEMYFLNKVEANLLKADGRQIDHIFYLDKGKGFTMKEMFNLLDKNENEKGRAVYKEYSNKDGEKYYGWKQLDLSEKQENGNYKFLIYHNNYGYDLEKALSKAPIGDLNANEKQALIQSLQKGNLQAATDRNGDRIYLAADPESGKANKLHVYDKNMRAVTVEMRNSKHERGESQSESKGEKSSAAESRQPGENVKESEKDKGRAQANRRNGKDDEELLTKNDKKKATGKAQDGQDGDLLSKERQSTGKGLSR